MRIKLEGKLEYHCLYLNQNSEFKVKSGSSITERNKIANGLVDHELGDFPDYFPEFKVLIVVTMFNEEPECLSKTMKAIHKNVEEIVLQGLSENTIGVVVIVDGIKSFYDGIKKMKETNHRSQNFYDPIFDIDTIFNYHQIGKDFKETTGRELSPERKFEQLLKKKFKKPNFNSTKSLKNSQNYGRQHQKIMIKTAVKERFWEVSHSFHCKAKFCDTSKYFLNLYFCVKHENKKKLNSHLWYFGGFCKVVNPEYCVLIDVGTEPESKALYLLTEH